jgi:hypothetical protein
MEKSILEKSRFDGNEVTEMPLGLALVDTKPYPTLNGIRYEIIYTVCNFMSTGFPKKKPFCLSFSFSFTPTVLP